MASKNDDKLEELRKDVQNLALSTTTHAGSIDNIKESLEKLEDKFDELSKKTDSNKDEILKGVNDVFVKYIEFKPIKGFVYGLISLICVIVFAAAMTLIIAPNVQHKEQNSAIPTLLPPQ